MRETDPAEVLACRPAEEAAVLQFIGSSSVPAALLVEGEAGIGKSTLWGAGLTQALRQGMTVLSVRPAQSEARMSFAGLGDLLEPVADAVLLRIEPPVRAALEVALLRRMPAEVPPNEREIGAALLAALRCLATDGPVVLGIDDVQWLDRSSADVLAFALRRLRDEPVRVLLTQRTGDVPGQRAAEPSEVARIIIDAITLLSPQVITLGPLPDAEVARLVRTNLGPWTTGAGERSLVAASGGNPYWALELTKAVVATGQLPGADLPVPASLSALLTHKLSSQPEGARTALVVVAALSRPTWGATRRALSGMVADPDAAVDAAVAAGLVAETVGRLRPAHPLLGSAALAGLSPGQRRHLHRVLAEVSADPEQHARHLALATDGEADSAVAQSLEIGTRSARSRGATNTAAELAELAVQLTPPEERSELAGRRLLAAQLRFAVGDLVRACELAEDLVAAEPNAAEWPELLPLLVESTYWVRGQPAAQALLRTLLDRPELEVRLRAVALSCAADVGDALGTSRSELASEAIRLFDRLGDTDPGALSTALVYLSEDRLDAGEGMATELLDRAEAAEARHQEAHPRSIPVLNRVRSVRAYQLKLVDDLDGARAEILHALGLARAEGDEGSVPALLGHLALTELWAGDYAAGFAAADEGLAHAADAGGVAPATLYAARGLLAVHTGDAASARLLIDGQLSAGRVAPTKKTVAYQHVLGVADLMTGDLAGACDHLEQSWVAAQELGIHEPGRRQRLEADFGQVLVAVGQLDRAAELAEAQCAAGKRFGRPTLSGVGYRIEGLVQAAKGDLDAAAGLLDRAVLEHRSSPLALELPRSQLSLGLVHRRRKAKQLARTNLQAALDGFTAIGAASWVQLATEELSRLDGARLGAKLTATEDRVASLAAAGSNNREIAAALFISPRTVEGHLATVYRKLAIRGRANLPRP